MEQRPALLQVLVTLDKMNKAKRVYDQTADEDERQAADTIFADCYDWLTAHHIPIYYDQGPNLWLRRGLC